MLNINNHATLQHICKAKTESQPCKRAAKPTLLPAFCIPIERQNLTIGQQNKPQHLCPPPPTYTKNNFFPKYKNSHMKKTITLLLFVFTFSIIKAQTINNTALQGYPNSVVVKVYDVASKIILTNSQQTTLADLFQDEENEIASLIQNGATLKIIDSVKNSYKVMFNNTLSTTQFVDYYNNSVAAKANTTGRLMATMLRNKYNTDATMQQYFNNIIRWREEVIEKNWLRETDSTKRNDNLANAMYVYDSLLSVYTNVAASSNYFSSMVYYMDSINHIDSSQKSALAISYYNSCIQYKNRAYADNFKTALTTVFNNVTDSPYYVALYKNEIFNTTQNATQLALATYVKRDKISTYTAQQILPLVEQRERVIAVLNKIYPIYTAAKDSIVDTLTISYQNQIDNFVMNGGSVINPSQISIAIKYATELGLSQEQLTALATKQTELNTLQNEFKRDHPEGDYDSKAFESEVLNSLLHEEQYTQVLTLKFNTSATNLANTDWSELVRLDLSSHYEITPTKTALTNYHLAVLIAYYRNANNPELQYSSIRSINQIMPDAMRELLNKWEYHTPYTDTIDTFFQW